MISGTHVKQGEHSVLLSDLTESEVAQVVFVRNREMGPAQKNYNKIPYHIARSVWELFHINRFLKKLCLFGTGL